MNGDNNNNHQAYREWARKKKGIVEPEMVAPITAHAAFDKAANYFGIKLIRVPVDETTFKVVPEVVEKAVTANTIAIVGSTPQFPQGETTVACCVDCCLACNMLTLCCSCCCCI